MAKVSASFIAASDIGAEFPDCPRIIANILYTDDRA
jgi:hypothetical protein